MELIVNGKKHTVSVPDGKPLLWVLRDDLELTGSKYGCGEGQCGACTVLIGGQAVRSCITPASAAAGQPVTTVEGIEQDGRLHPLQQAFLDEDAMQCGYCTAGMIMQGVALLKRNGNPSEQDIRRAMNGNVCRCGTYNRIVAAVRRAAAAQAGKSGGNGGAK